MSVYLHLIVFGMFFLLDPGLNIPELANYQAKIALIYCCMLAIIVRGSFKLYHSTFNNLLGGVLVKHIIIPYQSVSK